MGNKPHTPAKSPRDELSIAEHVRGVLDQNRRILSQTITKIESQLPRHQEQSDQIVQALLPHRKESIRIAVSGIPGAGKSTLIEQLGLLALQKDHRVAVLAIDPTSTISRGSIMGDKTRMEQLAQSGKAFIRPSPTAGSLGGVARKTRETISICEAAGYDLILIETVGVGQSEISARSMTDMFLLVLIPGTGDELQGIKRGVMEITDLVIINKADGTNRSCALETQQKYQNVLHFLTPVSRGWLQKVETCSALLNQRIDIIWENIQQFQKTTRQNGFFQQRRSLQAYQWFLDIVEQHLKEAFYSRPPIQRELQLLKEEILQNKLFPTLAARRILDLFFKK